MSEVGMNNSYWFGPFRLDIVNGFLFKGEEFVRLTPKQFQVLCFLVENAGRSISTDEILDNVWPDKDVELNNVTQNIGAVRKALGDDRKPYKYIKTLITSKERETKYCFIAEVRRDEDFQKGMLRKVKSGQPETLRQGEASSVSQPAKETVPAEDSEAVMISFQEWLRGPGKSIKLFFGIFVILLIAFSIALLVWEITGRSPQQRAESLVSMSFVSVAQLVVICLILFKYPPRPNKIRAIKTEGDKESNVEAGKALGYDDPAEWSNAQRIAEEMQERYELCWRGVLATWILLYGFLVVQYAYLPKSTWLRIIIDLINNINTMLVYLCYVILYKPVVSEKDDRANADASWIISKAINGMVVVATVFFLELVSVWLPYSFDHNSYLSGILLGLFTLGSGIIGGIVMALYVGRLQSKFLDPPSWLIFLLYSYTALQSFYWYLAEPNINEVTRQVGTVILIDAYLGLKCLLYLYMTWLFQSGSLLYYLARVGNTYHKVKEERQAFQRILKGV